LIIAIEALRRIGLEDFTITLSHVDFFNGIADHLELDQVQRRRLQETVDRKQTDQLNSFLEQYLDPESRNAFCRLTSLAGKGAIIEEARTLVSNTKSADALSDVQRVYQIAEALGIDTFVDIDLGDVAGLDYYTGLTFNIYAKGLGSALGRGGRYDQLLSSFGAPEPAVGFSLCLDWLAQLLSPEIRWRVSRSDEAVRLSPAADLVAAFKEATGLRSKGRKVEIVE
jgi:ATP phosphoribosyltransferase regulatory subunit